MLYEPVKRLTGIHNIFQQAIGASQKVFEYLDHAEEIQDRPGAVALAGFSYAIRFENVNFRYPSTEELSAPRHRSGSSRGRSGSAGRPERRGEDNAGQPGAALL